MKKLYTRRLKGGLGNQLFMVFNTISKSLENNGDYLIFPNKVYKQNRTNKKRAEPKCIFNNIAYKINNKLASKQTKINKEDYEIVFLSGYTQFLNYNRFDAIVDIIGFRDYQINVKNKYNSMFNSKFKYISIHFRYGDYVCHNKNAKKYPHEVLKESYYINCLDEILRNEDKAKLKFLIFFEEHDPNVIEIINNLKNMFNINYEIIDPEISPDETLAIQSICNYNVIANSTFSLWGALLNNNIEKKVFCPKGGKNTHPAIYKHYKFNMISIK